MTAPALTPAQQYTRDKMAQYPLAMSDLSPLTRDFIAALVENAFARGRLSMMMEQSRKERV